MRACVCRCCEHFCPLYLFVMVIVSFLCFICLGVWLWTPKTILQEPRLIRSVEFFSLSRGPHNSLHNPVTPTHTHTHTHIHTHTSTSTHARSFTHILTHTHTHTHTHTQFLWSSIPILIWSRTNLLEFFSSGNFLWSLSLYSGGGVKRENFAFSIFLAAKRRKILVVRFFLVLFFVNFEFISYTILTYIYTMDINWKWTSKWTWTLLALKYFLNPPVPRDQRWALAVILNCS